MYVLACINLKGGVGKTSLAFHLCGALAQRGVRTLAVDNDPQSSLTAGFFGPQAARDLDPSTTVAAVHAGDDPFPEAVLRPIGIDRLTLLAGSRFAARFNRPEPNLAPYEDQARLRDFLAVVRDNFDIAVIDNPPTLALASWTAMAAADAVLVPVQPEDWGAQGTVDVIESVEAVRAVINTGLGDPWYVVSMLQPRRAVHQAFVAQLRESFGPAVLDAMVPESADFVEAVVRRKPVGFHKPRGAAARVIRDAAEELLGRLAATTARAGEAA
jgi:chromosome partitioning protein